MVKQTRAQRVDALLEIAGTTLTKQAGIRLRDEPAPLFQLVVLAILLAKPISADVAVAACHELIAAGLTTPKKMRATSWQHRVDVLGRAHYRRYDESTATRLGEASQLIIERYRGDLRRLGEASEHSREHAVKLLEEIPGIGPTGASIFLREAQAVWPWVGPYFDDRALAGANKLDLRATARGLALLTAGRDPARFAAALVRADLDDSIPAAVLSPRHKE
jgi:endonuclease III